MEYLLIANCFAAHSCIHTVGAARRWRWHPADPQMAVGTQHCADVFGKVFYSCIQDIYIYILIHIYICV